MHKSPIYLLRVLLVVAIFLVTAPAESIAQTVDYKTDPVWIKMIDDPNANYFEVIEAYETYWMYHEKPKDEEEQMKMNPGNPPSEKMTDEEIKKREEYLRERESQYEKDRNKTFTEKEMKELAEIQEMTYQCKRFSNWKREVKPFVQNDGRILSQEERMKIYNDQMEEQNKQNKR